MLIPSHKYVCFIKCFSLRVDPTCPSWLRTQADLYFVEGQHSTAMKFYLEAGQHTAVFILILLLE